MDYEEKAHFGAPFCCWLTLGESIAETRARSREFEKASLYGIRIIL